MPRMELSSTALKTAAYQDPGALLELEFHSGAIYRYFGVPPQTYQELLGAASKGTYFHYQIRDRFPYAKVHPADPTSGFPTHRGAAYRATR
jgi:hypothetical protein